ncbi:MAG: translation elongation factor Ts, partial [Planctomycetaceae bacterium]
MAEITAADVKRLRDMTDLPMMKCKQALQEAGGDIEKAKDVLKRKMKEKFEERSVRETKEGRVFIRIADDGSKAAMLEIQCESAPVAGGAHLATFGEDAVRQLLEGPGAKSAEELLAQSATKGPALGEQLEEMATKIGENIKATRVARMDGPVAGYVHHDGKTGVLFAAEGDKTASPVLRDVAMQIAALRPSVTHVADLDPAAVKVERDRLSEEARATGKPENIIEKIVDGRMKNFYVDQGVLVVQPFVKDEAKTVEKALA